MTRHRVGQIVYGLATVSILLYSWMSYQTRLWVYGIGLVISGSLLIAWHVVPWVRRRGWRRHDPWPWDMPAAGQPDDHAFWRH